MAGPGRPGPGKASPGRPGLARAGHFFAREVASSFELVETLCDIAATNCTEVADSFTCNFYRERERDKNCSLKSATKIAQKIECVNGP